MDSSVAIGVVRDIFLLLYLKSLFHAELKLPHWDTLSLDGEFVCNMWADGAYFLTWEMQWSLS